MRSKFATPGEHSNHGTMRTSKSLQAHKARDLRVLVLPSSYPETHGPHTGIFFQDQVRALHGYGVKVDVIYPEMRSLRTISKGKLWANRFQEARYEEQGVQTYRIHGWNFPRTRLAPALWLHLAMKLVRSYVTGVAVPDLIFAHNALWAGVAARKAERQLGIPYVLGEQSSGYVRGLVRARNEIGAREAYSGASAIIAVSQALKQSIASFAPGKNIAVVSNTVDTEYFSLAPSRAPVAPFRFLTVANLKPEKGVDLVLRAFAGAFGSESSAELVLGGEGPERSALEKLTRELGIARRVHFLGFLSREQVRAAMWRASAFVLPSRFETFGVVLIEAMATGLPVIATRSGGPESIVTPEVGILVAREDPSALAGALRDMHQRHTQFDAERIRQYAIAGYARDSIARQLVSIFSAALDSYQRETESAVDGGSGLRVQTTR